MSERLVRQRCDECGEPVLRATGPAGQILVLDPSIPVAAVLVRGAFTAEAWPTTAAMAQHAPICASRRVERALARRTGGASLITEPLA